MDKSTYLSPTCVCIETFVKEPLMTVSSNLLISNSIEDIKEEDYKW